MSKRFESLEEVTAATAAAIARARFFYRVQWVLIVLCGLALVAAVTLKFLGGRPVVVMWLGFFGGLCGFGCWWAGRFVEPVVAKVEEMKATLAKFESRIPLTIGFANLAGDDLRPMMQADEAALSPLFARSRVVADHQIPGAEVLLVYAHLNEDGTIKGPTTTGLRQVVQMTQSPIVVLASPNSPLSLRNAVALPGPKSANLVLVLDRKGAALGRFLRSLFEKMRDGKDMLSAWVEIAPQGPDGSPHQPATMLVAEAGKIAFPRGPVA